MSSLTRFVLAQRRRCTRNTLSPSKTRSLSLPPTNRPSGNFDSDNNRPHSPIMEDLECTICNEEFSETRERQPRTLHCGHTFCTNCLNNMFSNPKKKPFDTSSRCPICRSVFRTVELNKIPVSFTILNIVLEIKKQRMRKRNSLGQGALESIGYCTTHSSPRQFWCSTCSEWMCGACVVLNHTKEKMCDIKTVEEMVNSQKTIHEEDHEKAKSSHQNIVDSILNACDICDTSKSLLRYDVESLRNRIKYTSKQIKSFETVQQKMKFTCSNVNEEWSVYSSLSEEVERAKNYSQFEFASEKFQNLPVNYLKKDFYVRFQPKTWTKKLLLECWLKHPSSKFFVDDDRQEANNIFSVSVRWPSLCIHSGIVQYLPLGALVIKLTDVTKQNETNFFLDLCYDSEINLHFKISIFQKHEFLDKFTDFCLGKSGSSYKEQPFYHLEIIEKTEAKIIWVDYQMSNNDNKSSCNKDPTEICDSPLQRSSEEESLPMGELLEPFSIEEVTNSSNAKEEPLNTVAKVEPVNITNSNKTLLVRPDKQEVSDKDQASSCDIISGSSSFQRSPISTISEEKKDEDLLESDIEDAKLSPTKSEDYRSADENPKIIVHLAAIHPEGTIFACLDNDKGDFGSKFGILLSSSSVGNYNYIDVGSVVEGELGFLQNELQAKNINQLVIKDCGYKIDMSQTF